MGANTRGIPAHYFALLRDFLRRLGIDTGAVLDAAGLSPARFERLDERLGLAEVEGLLRAAQAVSGRSHLGIDMGLLIKTTSHNLLGLGMMSSRNLDEALRLVARHYHLMNELFLLRYRRVAGQGEAIYTPVLAMAPETMRFFLDMLAVAHHRQVSMILGQDVGPYDYFLSAPVPADLTPYGVLRPARVHFEEDGVPGLRVVMDATLLAEPLPMADARMAAEIDARCAALVPARPAADLPWGDFIAMLLREAAGPPLSLGEIAARTRQSVRSIERRLKREGLTFRALVQRRQMERARALLDRPGARVATVAAQLGFSDVANFSRAFKRETGLSPGAFRDRAVRSGDGGNEAG